MPSLRSASIQTGSTHTESEYEDETDAEDEPPVKPKRGTAKSKSLNSEADTKRSKSGPISSKPVLGSMKTKAAKAAPAPKPVRTVKVDDEEDNAPTGRKRKGVTRSPTPPPTLANRPVKKSKLETSPKAPAPSTSQRRNIQSADLEIGHSQRKPSASNRRDTQDAEPAIDDDFEDARLTLPVSYEHWAVIIGHLCGLRMTILHDLESPDGLRTGLSGYKCFYRPPHAPGLDLSFTLTAFPSSADGQAFIYSPLKCTLPDGWVLPETLAKEGRFSATLLSRFFKKLLSIRKP